MLSAKCQTEQNQFQLAFLFTSQTAKLKSNSLIDLLLFFCSYEYWLGLASAGRALGLRRLAATSSTPPLLLFLASFRTAKVVSNFKLLAFLKHQQPTQKRWQQEEKEAMAAIQAQTFLYLH